MISAVDYLFKELDLIKMSPRNQWVEKRKEIYTKAKQLEQENINKAIQDGYEGCCSSKTQVNIKPEININWAEKIFGLAKDEGTDEEFDEQIKDL